VSQRAVAVARRAIAAFNARDIDGFAALTTPDFEWFPSMGPIESETFIGRAGVRKYFDGLGSAWDHFNVLPDEFRPYDSGVLVLGRLEGRGRGSGVTVDASLGMAFDLRDGMISRIRGYLDHDQALEAVGIEG
jgi:ketosteroid isomerase-like protein